MIVGNVRQASKKLDKVLFDLLYKLI